MAGSVVNFKPGDMVLVVTPADIPWPDPLTGRVGSVLAIEGNNWSCGAPIYMVAFSDDTALRCGHSLRKIEPPEPGNWDECVWSPSREVA